MSILSLRCPLILLSAAASQPVIPTTLPVGAATVTPIDLLFTALAVALFLGLGVWRPRSVVGPNRLPARGKTGIVILSLGLGLFIWLFAQAAYGAYAVRLLKQQGIEHPEKHLLEYLSPKDSAILSTVPSAAGFLVMLLVLGVNKIAARIGLGTKRLPLGIGAGILAFVVVFPAILWASAGVEFAYRRYHYHHEAEHPLLKEFGQASSTRWQMVIVIGALIGAPLFEELLFRGHFQTLLRQGFAKLAARGRAILPRIDSPELTPQVWLTNPPPPPPGVMAYRIAAVAAQTELPELPQQTAAWPSWLAIVCTAVIFALVHPIWTAPLIFLLAIGLGYVYERTGTLWACITLHLLFNGVETLIYYVHLPGK